MAWSLMKSLAYAAIADISFFFSRYSLW